MTSAQQPMTDLHRKLISAATAYDRRCEPVNIYRLGLILDAVSRAEQCMARGQPVRGALCRFFKDRLLDAMLKAAGEPPENTFERLRPHSSQEA